MSNVNWTFLTNHAHVLLCIAKNPRLTLRELASNVGITERAVHMIVTDLLDAGFVEVERVGRCNVYHTHPEKSLRHPLESDHLVSELLQLINLREKE